MLVVVRRQYAIDGEQLNSKTGRICKVRQGTTTLSDVSGVTRAGVIRDVDASMSDGKLLSL